MKHVLVVSEYFAPQNKVAAIRWTKIVKYLAQTGRFKITVITRRLDLSQKVIDKLLLKDSEYVDRFIYIDAPSVLHHTMAQNHASSGQQRTSGQTPGKHKVREDLARILSGLRQYRELVNNFLYYYKARKVIDLDSLSYDVIISSFGPLSSHYIGRYLKRKKKEAVWIADFRDPVNNWRIPLGLKHYMNRFARHVCQSAQAITGVSGGTLAALNLAAGTRQHVITNGFDRDDMPAAQPSRQDQAVMSFVYTGSLYPGKSTLKPVFDSLEWLIKEKCVDPSMIEIVYAGRSANLFAQEVRQTQLADRARIYDILSREDALALQQAADILLIAAWNTKGHAGVVTGKIFEYFMMDKPIIAVVTGELAGSELKKMIQKSKTGFCYEEANALTDAPLLKQYLEEKYLERIRNGCLRQYPDKAYQAQYDYVNIARQFQELIDELTPQAMEL